MNGISTLPRLSIEIAGARLTAEQGYCLEEARIQQRLSAPSLCELKFSEHASRESLPLLPGKTMRVSVGIDPETLFVGELTAIEYEYDPSGGRKIYLRGYDLLNRLRKRQPVRTHAQVNLDELARHLVADMGISVETKEGSLLWQRVIQYGQSDFDLLSEKAERCGQYFTLRGQVLSLLTLKGIGEPEKLVLGDSLFEARIEMNSIPACRAVFAAGWDPLRVESHNGGAKTARAADAESSRASSSSERALLNEVLQDDTEAEAIAQAELDLRYAQEVTLWGVAEGNPRLMPGTPIEVYGIATQFEGRYVLTAVNHTIDASCGFASEIMTVPPLPSPRPAGAETTLGIVTSVDDPEKLGRVQASLPAYGEIETGWMTVLIAGAGAGKGIVALPDVGDQVLVLFAGRDPAHGIVLGGLNGIQDPPDWGIDQGKVRRYSLLTRGGQKLQLDDTRNRVRIENRDGSYVELSPERVVLHAMSDLKIEAPGKAIVIKGQSIDFQRA